MSYKRRKSVLNPVLMALLLIAIAGCGVLGYQVYDLKQKDARMAEKIAAMEWSERLRDNLGRMDRVGRETEAEPVQDVEEQEEAEHKVYLTFDDGPSIYTDEILDILEQYDVKATFFVVGKEDEHSQAAIQRIVAEGHTLGMHSYSHRYTELYETLDSFIDDFTREQDYLAQVTGEECKFYRFPGGSSNTVSQQDMRIFAYYLESQDVMFFDWNVDSGDASNHHMSVDKMVENCTADLDRRGTSVILMHDSADKHTTVEALPQIIETIQAMDDTALLPITENTVLVQHLKR